MEERTPGWQGILARFGGALALVHATFNPTGHSYYHWTVEPFALAPENFPAGMNPVKALLGLLLLDEVLRIPAPPGRSGVMEPVLGGRVFGAAPAEGDPSR